MVSTTVLVRKRKIVVVVAPGDPRAVASEGVTEVSREIRPLMGVAHPSPVTRRGANRMG